MKVLFESGVVSLNPQENCRVVAAGMHPEVEVAYLLKYKT